jgi:hypothetical protein
MAVSSARPRRGSFNRASCFSACQLRPFLTAARGEPDKLFTRVFRIGFDDSCLYNLTALVLYDQLI